MSAWSNGVPLQSNAVLILSDAPGMDMQRAGQNIEELIEAGLIERDGKTLTLTVFGTTIVRDYGGWEAKG
jgi:predicted transcriptional regulator